METEMRSHQAGGGWLWHLPRPVSAVSGWLGVTVLVFLLQLAVLSVAEGVQKYVDGNLPPNVFWVWTLCVIITTLWSWGVGTTFSRIKPDVWYVKDSYLCILSWTCFVWHCHGRSVLANGVIKGAPGVAVFIVFFVLTLVCAHCGSRIAEGVGVFRRRLPRLALIVCLTLGIMYFGRWSLQNIPDGTLLFVPLSIPLFLRSRKEQLVP